MLRGARKEYLNGSRRHGGYRFSVKNFLFSRVGRPWAEVHSELSREFDRRTYAGYCFWRWEMKWVVALNCWVGADSGTIYDGEHPVSGFYVHPFTGDLCCAEPSVRQPHSQGFSTIHLADGSWYTYEVAGKSSKWRIKAWFHYRVEIVVSAKRRRLDIVQAEACRLEGKFQIERDEDGPFVWQWVYHDKVHKRSANREDIRWINRYISEKMDEDNHEKEKSQNHQCV